MHRPRHSLAEEQGSEVRPKISHTFWNNPSAGPLLKVSPFLLSGNHRVGHDWSDLAAAAAAAAAGVLFLGARVWFSLIQAFLGGSVIKILPTNARESGFDPWVRKIPWRREWQATPVFLPEKFHRQRSLAGYSPWGHKETDTTEWLNNSSNNKVLYWRADLLFWLAFWF